MTNIHNEEKLKDRAREVADHAALNGVRLLFMKLAPEAAPTHADVLVEFLNGNQLSAIQDDINNNRLELNEVFAVSGGSRIVGGDQAGQVQVTAITGQPTSSSLRLRIEPIGDYSTYTLSLNYANIDPIFDSIAFKFRPGCFNLNCAPEWEPSPAPQAEPAIDYLAKDFASFKHVLINAMAARVPGWAPTSEADLDQVLIDLIAADADELSDFQDRVMNEAYLAGARKRVSLARHARLMDYHIHPGNQAGTWLAVKVISDAELRPWHEAGGFGVWTGEAASTGQAIVDREAILYACTAKQPCFVLLNEIKPYTWGGLVTALEAGATRADLALPGSLDATKQSDAEQFAALFQRDDVQHLLLEQKLNPETGTVNGRDIEARQVVELLAGGDAAESTFDPKAGEWFVRVYWQDRDKLKRRYCFITDCTGEEEKDEVTLFHGNLVPVAHGRPHKTTFTAPGSILGGMVTHRLLHEDTAHYEPTLGLDEGDSPAWGTICRLPHAPLAYLDTRPGGEHWARSTLKIQVDGETWHERSDLIESKRDDRDFVVETDEHDISRIRFGNNVNGRALTGDAEVVCLYQVGQGEPGNVGAGKLTGFDRSVHPEVDAVWNPLDVNNGRPAEPPEQIIRRVPEAYRSRQLRAVTLEDYVERAEELDEVDHAAAAYVWTGSWRAVRVAIDPKGSTEVGDALRDQIARHLDAVRLVGDDVEIRPARYVPLDIELRLCAHPDFWPEDLDVALQREFSDGYTPDGRPGFFHPDQWTFGQPLYVSQITGRALTVTGVERLLQVNIRRVNPNPGPSLATVVVKPEDLSATDRHKVELDRFEIIQVENDPDRLESGRIEFDILGGRA